MPKLPTTSGATPPPAIGRTDALLARADKAEAEKRHDEAAKLYQMVLTVDPTNVDAINGLGATAGNLGDLLVAIQQFENSLRIDPSQVVIWYNHGLGLAKIGLIQEALGSFDRAIALEPRYGELYLERGSMLANLGRYEEALASYDVAMQILPNDSVTVKQRGISLQWRGEYGQALREFDRAIALKPDNAEAWVSKAFLMMTLGDLPGGLALYEWRWCMAGWLQSRRRLKRNYTSPLWLGDADLEGKTLLVYAEQGLGDTFQFCRYVDLAARSAAKVIVEVPPGLVGLMTTLSAASQVISDEDKLPDHDLRCPMMSMPLAFGTTMESIPADVPYLRADPILASTWRDRLPALPGRRIGLVWGAGTRVGDSELVSIEQRKSLPLLTLAPLASVAGCSFVSLQLGPPAAQVASAPPGMNLYDPTGDIRDFADTAALMENMDLIISVCTSTAHLAGALGRPVWLLNRFDTDWRWFLDREDSPWYPTMRIFRQPAPGDWASVSRSVTQALRAFVSA
jgi:Flp pilus assembly protein TadD